MIIVSQGDRQGPSPAEQLARAGAEKAIWKLVAWIGGGTLLLVILIIVIFAAVAIYLGGGMPGISNAPQIGTAQSRPTMWLSAPAIVQSSLPNVVILAVMEHESTGQVFARNYNCTFGLTSPKRCSQTYLGGVVHTKSEDAGLMGINSGGWPQTPKWQALGLAQDPFNPQANIAAGVEQLQADMAQYHYLKYALEAYNSGSGGPNSPDAAYAQAVLKDIQAYEKGPTLAVWSTASSAPSIRGPNGQIAPTYTVGPTQSYWILAAAAGPYGATYSVPWAPRPPKCTTPKSGPDKGKTACTPQPPTMLVGNALVPPATVVADNGPPPIPANCDNCQYALSVAPPLAPVWPGAHVWAVQQTSTPSYWPVFASWANRRSTSASIIVLGSNN